jgi:hypothetical protein
MSGAENASFEAIFNQKERSFCQDRLGTNIGKVEKKGRFLQDRVGFCSSHSTLSTTTPGRRLASAKPRGNCSSQVRNGVWLSDQYRRPQGQAKKLIYQD